MRFTALATALAIVIAAGLYLQFLEHPRTLWQGWDHDRSGHYLYGLDMGLALRDGDPLAFLKALERGKTWPPLHGVLVSLAVLAGGPRYVLAVLPSLLGWVLTVVCVVRLAVLLAPRGEVLAGAAALLFTLGSPSLSRFATDIMLESLGAGLTALVLLLYVLSLQRGPRAAPALWRALALSLTALFFEKYNYWLLVVVAIGADATLRHPKENGPFLARPRAARWHEATSRQVRDPRNLPAAAALVLTIFVALRGPTTLDVLGLPVSLYPPGNLLTVSFALVALRIGQGLRRGEMSWPERGSRSFELTAWHVVPVAASFLLPGRLWAFLAHLGPANHPSGGHEIVRDPLLYFRALSHDYFPGGWSLAAAAVLLLAAVVWRRQAPPGTDAMLVLLGTSALLTLAHPYHQSRFLHSWLPVAWAAAGAGLAAGLGTLAATPRRRGWLAAAVLAVLAAANGPAIVHAIWTPARETGSSLLDVTDAYLPDLDGSWRVAFLDAAGAESLMRWTFRERYGRGRELERFGGPPGRAPADIPARFRDWLRISTADTVVLLDGPGLERNTELVSLMRGQSVFAESRRIAVDRPRCVVSIWRRAEGPKG